MRPRVRMDVCVRAHARLRVYVQYVRTSVYTWACLYVHVCMQTCKCVCVVCIYAWIRTLVIKRMFYI